MNAQITADPQAQLWQRVAGSPWAGYLLRRLAGMVAVIASVVVLTFMIVHWVPGDPARQIAGLSASPADVDRIRDQLGLTKPLWRQFGEYVGNLLHGDLGSSFTNQQPVSSMIGQRLPLTVGLATAALAVVLIIGIPTGILFGVAEQRGRLRPLTSAFSVGASLFGAMPEYITGTLLIFVFALTLHWLPVQGALGFTALLMPTLSVALAPTAILARLVRNETQTVLSQEYITSAASKRLSGVRLVVRHVLPNVVTSTLTLGGLLLVALLGGTVITENVFNMAGLGSEIVQAILRRDYPEIQGIILLLGLIAVVINLLVDVTLGLLDPRVLARSRS